MRLISYLGATAVIFAAGPAFAAQFISLTDLVPGTVVSAIQDVSNDGSTVIGTYSFDGSTGRAFHWRLGVGLVELMRPNQQPISGSAIKTSHDGTKVLGFDVDYGAFVWTEGVGTQYLNIFPSEKYEVLDMSADASIITGNVERNSPQGGYHEAFRWSAASGVTILGAIPGSNGEHPYVAAISEDGSTIVGSHDFRNPDGTYDTHYAFRWTEATGTTSLGTPLGTVGTYAYETTTDGKVVLGAARIDNNSWNTFRWRASTGFELLGPNPFAPDGGTAYAPQDFTPEGDLIVGSAPKNDSSSLREPFIWDQLHHFRRLRTILESSTGMPLTGWDDLGVANAISTNGAVIGGYGVPNGGSQDQGWIMLFNRSEIAPQPVGDFNFDGTVDARDYLVWRDHVGYVVPACTGGDSNCNGFVEWVDYEPWRANYGRTYGSGIGATASIPEPSCSMLILIATAFIILRGDPAIQRESY